MVVIFVQTRLYVNNTKIIRVACIGDSITESTSYPIELQIKLGDNYRVENFGSSGATVLLDTFTPYIYQIEFFKAKDFLPNIVVIMLGTNDARTDNFKSITNFEGDYLKLINNIQDPNNNPIIFIVKPPPIFNNGLNLESKSFSEEIIPRIEKIANDQALQIIDVYGALEDHSEYFPDGVHPNNKGSAIISTEIYNAINSLQ
ncbi:hypothetical protein KJN74_04875 [Candidatus Bathyarchaeota archaeon]|nr:hypothetical protein [Candidatus Bathyarchaeota archaeon]